MLIIEKKYIVNINDEMLLKEFGVNYMRCPKLDDDIAAMLLSGSYGFREW